MQASRKTNWLPLLPSITRLSPAWTFIFLPGAFCRALGRLRHALGIQVRYHEGITLIGQCPADVMRVVGADVLLLALQLCQLAPDLSVPP